jgi:hypothetical protein
MTEATLEIREWVKQTGSFHHTYHEGRVFNVPAGAGVPEGPVYLYPIGVMAAAIDREPIMIVRWEAKKLWPKPMWVVPDKKIKRWYSRDQIKMAHRIYWALARGDHGVGHSRHFPHDEFLKRVRAEFYAVDALARGAQPPTRKANR